MSFFNKKEEVFDIELTSYGKYLFSKGKFKPAYYAFSDDEIIYDPSYNSSGSVELGEETFRRIVQNGISTKALYEGESAESRIHQLNGHTIRTDKSTGRAIRAGKINKTPVDDIYGKDYVDDINMQPANRGLVTNLLSTSRLGERFMPALSVKSLKSYAKFKSPIILSASSDTSISDGFRVPQIDIEVDFRTFTYEYDLGDLPEEALELQTEYDKDIIFKDGYRVLIDDRAVVLDFAEKNVTSFGDGFEYEMFLVEQDSVITKDDDGNIINKTKEILRKLQPGLESEQFDDKPVDISTFLEISTDEGIDNDTNFSDSDDILRLPGLGLPASISPEQLAILASQQDADEGGTSPSSGKTGAGGARLGPNLGFIPDSSNSPDANRRFIDTVYKADPEDEDCD